MHRSLPIAMFAVLALASGCKLKKNAPAAVVAPPRAATSLYDLGFICSSPVDHAFGGAPAFAKSDKPSKVAFFRKLTDTKSASYDTYANDLVGDAEAGERDAGSAQLVGCLDVTQVPGDVGYCTYDKGTVQLVTMKNTLRVYEVKTGMKVLEEEFVLDHKTGRCADTYSFSRYEKTVQEGIDPRPKVASLILPLEPAAVKLAPLASDKLDDVCSGSAIPEAAAYVAGTPTKVHAVYFPDSKRPFSREDLPTNMPELDNGTGSASDYGLVACITGQTKKKRRDCDSMQSDKVLTISDGQFEVKLFEARTGKPVETRSFKGSSPTGCPFSHKFWGKNDDVMTQVEPAMGRYLTSFEGRAVVASAAKTRRR